MHSERFLKDGDMHFVARDVAVELLRLGDSGRGFCVARTWCADAGYVVWAQNEGGEGIPFFHETLLGALRSARVWVETGEAAWQQSPTAT